MPPRHGGRTFSGRGTLFAVKSLVKQKKDSLMTVHNQHDIEEAARRRTHLTEEANTPRNEDHPPVATATRRSEEAPRSRGLPLTMQKRLGTKSSPEADVKLIHPILNRVPLHVRFGFNGLLCNVLFMFVYNTAVTHIHSVSSSTVYSIIYLFFIPFGHAMVSLLVFGWPERYIPSLMSNFPIGLTAIAIGGALTAYLDQIEFESRIEDFIRDNWTFSHMPARADEEQSEFYSSIVVLVVTSIWTYVLSVYINSSPAKSDKKEL